MKALFPFLCVAVRVPEDPKEGDVCEMITPEKYLQPFLAKDAQSARDAILRAVDQDIPTDEIAVYVSPFHSA